MLDIQENLEYNIVNQEFLERECRNVGVNMSNQSNIPEWVHEYEAKKASGVVFPRGVDSAKVILVIVTKSARGDGTKEEPVREVTEYWSMDGKKLAENDPN